MTVQTVWSCSGDSEYVTVLVDSRFVRTSSPREIYFTAIHQFQIIDLAPLTRITVFHCFYKLLSWELYMIVLADQSLYSGADSPLLSAVAQ